ncbi:CELF4 protein, partial [Polyodon spathula]|nr:CELF4 protein [Polyodon spathula]
MQQMAGQMGMFNPMAIQFGAYGAYAQAVSIETRVTGKGKVCPGNRQSFPRALQTNPPRKHFPNI